jgi:hypothetical protein
MFLTAQFGSWYVGGHLRANFRKPGFTGMDKDDAGKRDIVSVTDWTKLPDVSESREFGSYFVRPGPSKNARLRRQVRSVRSAGGNDGNYEAIRLVVVGGLDCRRRDVLVSIPPCIRSPHIRASIVLHHTIVIRFVLLDYLHGRPFYVEETT